MKIDIRKLNEEEKFKLNRALKLFGDGMSPPPSPSNLKWFVLDHALECAKEDLKNRNQLTEKLSKKERAIHHSLIEKLEGMKRPDNS